MSTFHHAPTCPCGNCHPVPAAGPTTCEMPCGCLFNDGDMYFCEEHEVQEETRLNTPMPLDPLNQSPPIAYHHTQGA